MALQSYTLALGNLADDGSGNNYASSKAVYVKSLNDTLAQIYSDGDGLNQITQDGIANITDSNGVFTFWVEAGDYYIEVDSDKYRVSITGADYFNNRIDETVNQIIEDVAGRGAYYPVGTFEAGFTYTDINQVGSFGGSDYYIYTGGITNLPHVVTAGTDPTLSSNYERVIYGSAENIQTTTGENQQQVNDRLDSGYSYLKDINVNDVEQLKQSAADFSLLTGGVKLKSFAIGTAESSSLSADYNFSKLDGVGVISTTPTSNHAWLASATGNEYITVQLPFAVIIGDSIAEGHPGLHGRLHQSYVDPTYNNAILNEYGQPSYELSRRTGIFWYNSGIGGQTTTEILARFDRDALGDVVSVGDGRPNQTLPRQPIWIWVNAGINDVSALTSTAITKRNLLEMCVKARRRGLNIGFNTIGPVNSHDATQRAMQNDINEFILSVLPMYGAHTFDFHNWFANPSDPTQINPIYDADGVHPNKSGYTNYAARLLDNPDLPIFFNGLYVETGIGETISPNFRRPTAIEFEDARGLRGKIPLESDVEFVKPDIVQLISSATKIHVRDVEGGIDATKHTGFTNISFTVGRRTTNTPVEISAEEKSKVVGAHIAKVSGTWQVIATTGSSEVASVAANSTEITVTFDNAVRLPSAGMIGTTEPSVYSATGDGLVAASCRVKAFDLIDGTQRNPTTMTDNSGFWISAIKL